LAEKRASFLRELDYLTQEISLIFDLFIDQNDRAENGMTGIVKLAA